MTAEFVNAEWARVSAERIAEVDRLNARIDAEREARRPADFADFCAKAGIGLDERTAADLLAAGDLSDEVLGAFEMHCLVGPLMVATANLDPMSEKTRWLAESSDAFRERQGWARFLLASGSLPRSPATLRTLGTVRSGGVACRGVSRRTQRRQERSPQGGRRD